MEGRTRTFVLLLVGGSLALLANGIVANLMNKVLGPLGITYV